MSPRAAATALLPAALAATLLAGCSSSGSGEQAPGGARASDAGADAHVANVVVTAAHGCQADKQAFAAGGITFKITNKDATAVSEVELLSGERIVGEKENLPPGFGGEFAVTVPAGTYTIYCPGGH